MTGFLSLPPELRLGITGFMFLAECGELAFLLICFFAGVKWQKCVKEGLFFAGLLLMLSWLAMPVHGKDISGALHEIPWALPAGIACIVLIRAGYGVWVEYRHSRSRLSGYAVKQALDNLKSGILFADKTGRIILINYTMEHLVSGLTGSSPQMLYELADALEHKTGKIVPGRWENARVYEFPDGQMWRFQMASLKKEEIAGFIYVMAQNVTEPMEYNSRLEAENDALRRTNEELQKMYERLADRIREQETLNLKIRVHNDIGTSLVAISELLENGGSGEVDEQLGVLQNAVGYLGTGAPGETMEDIRRQAEGMHVKLVVEDSKLKDVRSEGLLALVARECVTNCVKHAGGDEVHVRIERCGDWLEAVYTNNGKVPEHQIKEGGGLLALRRKIEDYGGQMRVAYEPIFALTVELPV